MRQAGVLDRMVQLLEDPRLSESANVMLLQSLSNMALNVNNQKSSKVSVSLGCHQLFIDFLRFQRRCLPLLIARLRQPRCSELEKMTSFRALLNYTTEIDGTDAETLIPLIPTLYSR